MNIKRSIITRLSGGVVIKKNKSVVSGNYFYLLSMNAVALYRNISFVKQQVGEF
jgi:hypothetical protein